MSIQFKGKEIKRERERERDKIHVSDILSMGSLNL